MAIRSLIEAAARGATRAPSPATVDDLIKEGYPESVAIRIASGELDMSPQARSSRQQSMFPEIVYHGSMQDIVGEYIPRYADNLMFTTPSPQFASEWAGKGAMQKRAGELDAFDRYRPQKEKIYQELGSPQFGTPEYDEFTKRTTDIFRQEQNAFKTTYPLAVRAQNPFDPTAEGMYEKVTEPLFKKQFGVEKLDPETERYLRKGAYLYFEDPDVIKELDSLGYDSVRLRENTDGPLDTLAMFDGSRNVRSLLSAAFDPEYTGSNIMGSRLAPTAVAGLLGAGAMMAPEDAEANPLTRSIKAYHGSPYRFDEFKREAIGTGEGNQAYGYGLYFAEAEDVAKAYKKAPEVLEGFDNFAMSEAADSYLYDLGESLRKSDPLLSNAISELRVGDFSPDVIKRKMKDLDDDFTAEEIEAAAARFDDVIKKINKDFSGSMYEVNLNVSPDDLIDWDKPISQQSDSVKKAIEASRQKLPPNALDDLGGDLSFLYGKDVSVGDFLGNMQAIGGRSDFGESLLGDLGVKGIRYKDQFSRGGDEGTNNYVIFDPRVIEISRTYSISIPQASELLAQQDRQRQGLLSQIDPVEQRVQQLMQPLAQEPGYNYGDILPIKRSTDPARREEFPYGIEPAIPNMARGLLEEAVRAYEMNKAGRQREATQSAMGLLF